MILSAINIDFRVVDVPRYDRTIIAGSAQLTSFKAM